MREFIFCDVTITAETNFSKVNDAKQLIANLKPAAGDIRAELSWKTKSRYIYCDKLSTFN